MARVTALRLRDLARQAMLDAGGRGFMRFADGADALLVTDALRCCGSEDAAAHIVSSLHARGFACVQASGLWLLDPSDALIETLCPAVLPGIDWSSSLHPAMALAARWLKAPKLPLTRGGRRLVRECLRLTGRPGEDVCGGLGALRAQAAVMLRAGDRSGLREAGMILCEWCDGRNDDEA